MNRPLPRCFHTRLKTFSARCIAAWVAAATLLLGLSQNTAAQVFLDFSTEDQYTNNFVQMRNSGNPMAWTDLQNGPDGQPGIVAGNHSSTVSQFRYDSNLTPERDTYLTETVASDLGYSTLTGTNNHGIFLRVQDNDLGVLVLVSYLSTTSIRVRMGYGAELTTTGSGIGTIFWDGTFNLADGTITNDIGTGGTGSTNTIAASNQWTHFEIAQTGGDDPTFDLTLSDTQGFILSAGTVALTATDSYNTAGSIGFRINNGSGTTNDRLDNFAIIPEPGTLAMLLGGIGVLMVVLRRPHRA